MVMVVETTSPGREGAPDRFSAPSSLCIYPDWEQLLSCASGASVLYPEEEGESAFVTRRNNNKTTKLQKLWEFATESEEFATKSESKLTLPSKFLEPEEREPSTSSFSYSNEEANQISRPQQQEKFKGYAQVTQKETIEGAERYRTSTLVKSRSFLTTTTNPKNSNKQHKNDCSSATIHMVDQVLEFQQTMLVSDANHRGLVSPTAAHRLRSTPTLAFQYSSSSSDEDSCSSSYLEGEDVDEPELGPSVSTLTNPQTSGSQRRSSNSMERSKILEQIGLATSMQISKQTLQPQQPLSVFLSSTLSSLCDDIDAEDDEEDEENSIQDSKEILEQRLQQRQEKNDVEDRDHPDIPLVLSSVLSTHGGRNESRSTDPSRLHQTWQSLTEVESEEEEARPLDKIRYCETHTTFQQHEMATRLQQWYWRCLAQRTARTTAALVIQSWFWNQKHQQYEEQKQQKEQELHQRQQQHQKEQQLHQLQAAAIVHATCEAQAAICVAQAWCRYRHRRLSAARVLIKAWRHYHFQGVLEQRLERSRGQRAAQAIQEAAFLF